VRGHEGDVGGARGEQRALVIGQGRGCGKETG
jgi:hypothetical protein